MTITSAADFVRYCPTNAHAPYPRSAIKIPTQADNPVAQTEERKKQAELHLPHDIGVLHGNDGGSHQRRAHDTDVGSQSIVSCPYGKIRREEKQDEIDNADHAEAEI